MNFNKKIYEKIYKILPLRFDGENKKGKVFKLQHALSGMRHAPWPWYSMTDNYIQQVFFKSKENLHLYFSIKDGKHTTVLL